MTVLFKGDTLSDFPVHNYFAGDITEVKDPLGSGQNVFKLQVDNSPSFLGDGTPRAEGVTAELFAENEEVWYVAHFYVPTSTSEPDGLPKVTTWLNFGEMFAHPWTFSSPRPIFMWPVSGAEYLVCRRPKGKTDNGSEDRPYQIPFPRGKWIRLIVHEKFSKSEGTGFTEWFLKIGSEAEYQVTFFKSGQSLNPEGLAETKKMVAVTLHSDTDAKTAWHYPKHYRAAGQFTTGTIYEKPTCVATTRADIDNFLTEMEGAPPAEKPDLDYITEKSKFGLLHIEAENRLTEVADPLGLYEGPHVLKFLTLDHDQLVYSGNPRTEAQGHTGKFGDGSTIWWGFDFMMPAAFPKVPSGGWLSIASIYGGPGTHESPIRIEVKNNKLMWQRSELYGYDVPWEYGAPPRDKWVSIKVHEKLGTAGYIELWIKVGTGKWEQVTFFKGTGSATTQLFMNTIDSIIEGTHMKIMQYRLESMAGFEDANNPTLYHTGIRVATTEALVENPYGFGAGTPKSPVPQKGRPVKTLKPGDAKVNSGELWTALSDANDATRITATLK